MSIRNLFFLLAVPLCCFAEMVNTTTRDYTMVDLHNRLTTELLTVGPTSITISVEWPLDMAPYGDIACFNLMGKTNIEERGWHDLAQMTADQIQGKTTFEVLYGDTSWNYFGESANFEKKIWFAVRVPLMRADMPYTVGCRGMYEKDDEEDHELLHRMEEEMAEEREKEVQKILQGRYEERERTIVAETEAAHGDPAVPVPRDAMRYLLLILPVICAVFYFMRKKGKKTP